MFLSAEDFGMSQFLEILLILSTIGLIIPTIGVWVVTAKVHKDEILKLAQGMENANDNMTSVALAEISAHHTEKVQELRKISRRKHR